MRRLKPYKIEELYIKGTGHKVEIMFDRNDQEFFVEFAGKIIASGPLLDQVRKEATKELEAMVDFKWKRVIIAQFHSNKTEEERYRWGAGPKGEHSIRIDCKFSRHEYAERPGREGFHVERPFGEEDTPIHKYTPYSCSSSFETEIPYSEEAWIALLAIEERFEELCKKLFEMFKGEDFESKLKQISEHFPLLLEWRKEGKCK